MLNKFKSEAINCQGSSSLFINAKFEDLKEKRKKAIRQNVVWIETVIRLIMSRFM